MGEVYLAQDEKLHRQVALKFLPEHLTRDEERKQRFVREARAAAAIEHPHIGAIYDIDEVEGRTFMAMEYVRGESLRQAISKGTLSSRKSVELGIQIAEGLAKAHERGVVHRDLKPDNVILSEDGYAKIIDFGLAKLLEPLTQPGVQPSDSDEATWVKTREGMVLGTVAYMSPEQARGGTVDHRSDVFSFGALLYEMLSGKAPFRRSSVFDTLAAVIKENPAPLSLEGSGVPPDIHRILKKCLVKDPAERYQTMKDLAIDLREVREEFGSTTRTAVVADDRTFPWKWVAALAVAVAAGALGFSLWGGDRIPPGVGAAGRPAVAVMYFQDHTGADEIRWLSTGLPDMLLTGLAQTPGLDVVSSQRIHEILREVGQENVDAIDKSLIAEVARRSGAGAVVVGSIYKAGDDLRIDVQIQDVESGRLLGAESVRGADVFPLVDDLANRIRSRLELTDQPRGRPLAEVTTNSLEAYQHYRKGLEARYNVRQRDARAHFKEAVRIDPSFAMAYFRLWQTAGTLGEPVQAEAFRQKVLEHLERLPERKKVLVQARSTWDPGGDPRKAAELLEGLIAQYPDEEEAYDVLVHIHARDLRDPAGLLDLLERWAQAFPGPGSAHHLNHYGYALLENRRYDDAIRKFETYARAFPNEANPFDSLGEVYLVTGRAEKAIENYSKALAVDPSFGSSYLGRAFAHGMLGRYQESLAELGRLEGPGARAEFTVPVIRLFQGFLLSRVGKYQEAERTIQEGLRLAAESENTQDRIHLLLLSAWLSLEREAYSEVLSSTQEAAALVPSIPTPFFRDFSTSLEALLSGVAELRTDEMASARTRLERLAEHEDSDRPFLKWAHHALAGEIALAGGDLAAAATAFDIGQPEPRMWFNLATTAQTVFANQLPVRDGPARIKEAQGDPNGAIEIYRQLNTTDSSSRWIAMLEPRYVLEIARLLDQKGDDEAAREEYRRFLELWSNADAGLPELEEARAFVEAH